MKKKQKGVVLSIVPRLEQKKAEENSDQFTVMEALEEAIHDVNDTDTDEPNAFSTATKLMIIALDDTDGMYHTGFIQSGFKMSECVALMEVMKVRFLEHMGRL